MIFKDKAKTSVRVVNGKLILSFPHAITPVVWQMDLSHAKSCAFEIHVDDKKGQTSLTTREAGEKTKEVIASFVTQDQAIEGLVATSQALENAYSFSDAGRPVKGQGFSGGAAMQGLVPTNDKSAMAKFGAICVGLIIIVALFAFMQSMQSQYPASVQSITNIDTASASGAGGNGVADAAGVPVSADDFLMQR